MKRSLSFLTVILATFASASVFAQSGTDTSPAKAPITPALINTPELFKKLDANGDGKIDQQEFEKITVVAPQAGYYQHLKSPEAPATPPKIQPPATHLDSEGQQSQGSGSGSGGTVR